MQNLSEAAREHFLNPRNVGDLSEPAATGRAGSFICGAALRVSLHVDETQRIASARFKAAGCVFLIASASLLTERIKGKTTGEAATLLQSPEYAVEGALDDLP